jgi:hypothetical protein
VKYKKRDVKEKFMCRELEGKKKTWGKKEKRENYESRIIKKLGYLIIDL